MNADTEVTNEVVEYLLQVKVAQTKNLAKYFKCSKRTIFRKLKVHGYLTSYNMNGSILTLPEIPNFNDKGLWIYEKAGFSIWKTLKRTIYQVVENSEAGLTASECKNLLQANVYNHLTLNSKSGSIICEKRPWGSVYFSTNEERRNQQLKARERIDKKRFPKKMRLNKDTIIKILVVALKNHTTSIKDLLPLLISEDIRVSKKAVEWVFHKYQIKKKAFP